MRFLYLKFFRFCYIVDYVDIEFMLRNRYNKKLSVDIKKETNYIINIFYVIIALRSSENFILE